MHKAHSETDNILKYFFIITTFIFFVIGFFPTMEKLSIRWSGGDNDYCYLIVPLFIYLCWDKRERFRFGQFSWALWGLVPVFLSMLLMMFGEIGSLETILYTGLWGCVVGVFITLYGNRTRLLAFPLFILLFIVPLPPFINRILTFNLKMAASTLAVKMLRLTGASVLQQGNIIDIGMTQLQVVDACSGLRFFMPLILMAILVGYFFVKRHWQWIILILMVPPLTVFVNAFRIFVTGVLIRSGYPELAEHFFHDFSGWLVFMVAGAILVGIAFLMRKIGKHYADRGGRYADGGKRLEVGGEEKNGLGKRLEAEGDMPQTSNLKPQTAEGMLRPAVLTVVVCFLFVGSGWAMKKIPSARNLPPRDSFDSFPVQIAHWHGKKRTIEDKILKELWADDYLNAFFKHSKTPNSIYLLIPFYEYQGTRHTAHAPQSCLLGGGWDLLKDQNHIVAVHLNRNIEIRTMHLRKGDFRMLGSYFFFQRSRVITSPWMNKLYLVWDSITRQRTDGALVRVEMTLAPDQSMESAYAMLDEFIKALWPILPEYIPS
ncbi:MAG: EpsI family protein [Thermodesulfobacteriota bacterium]|nr:EpsI family protein [Thermodesulfobacteriota bacterium]